ncbi:(2Fe-2S)-binding protein [Spongiibacter tropicus]|uniref:(2Fe-2S)-binding protein n=1 Tax=Spongiibacter tropicus TaxID=454602 RepID=UPI0003B4F78D|nr:(2Fe-2S)-binding protein [Spongiibacter tropicus]
MQIELKINGETLSADIDDDTPLLWVLRDELALTGTKFGCGIAQCGACTVLMNGNPVRACVMPAQAMVGAEITTIEGLGGEHPLQKAWVARNVPQCGYCQSGQIMAAKALLDKTPQPSDEQIDAAMSGNVCRCGTYQRIREAIHDAADLVAAEK